MQFSQLPEGTFVISCGDTWERTTAKTLLGAKMIASRTFQQTVGCKIEVGVTVGREETQRVETVAIKRGYEKWTAPY